jgi:hypothetical protein
MGLAIITERTAPMIEKERGNYVHGYVDAALQ